ncbi:MAG: radical SAM protein [Candidatus Omnitrophica bacterium]|nr:radical SAM protein [Candidatus Omnitrophota bacterium]
MKDTWWLRLACFLSSDFANKYRQKIQTKTRDDLPVRISARETQNIFTMLGDDAELHDRIYDVQGNFHETYRKIQQAVNDQQSFKIVVGISRYNFYCLDAIINFCFSLYGETTRIKQPFDIFPVQKIAGRYKKHIKILQKELKFQNTVILEYVDDEFSEILSRLQEQVRLNPLYEREYIRFFSIICEKTFIGPATIVMDLYHRCNTNCRHCWVHTPVLSQPEEFLNRTIDDNLFHSIIDDAAAMQSNLVIFQGDGEPLMYEKTIERLRYVRQKGIDAMIFTNGFLLNEKRSLELIDMGVKEIYCSLPAGTKETYGRVCPKHINDDFFDQIVANLKAFVCLRKKQGKEFPRLIMTHVMHNENYQDLIQMAKLSVTVDADAARFYLIRLDDMNMDLKLTTEQVRNMCGDIGKAEKILNKHGIHFIDNVRFQFEHYNEQTGSWCDDVFLKQGCFVGWFFCLIPALTDLSLCCHLRTLGNLKKIRFKDLWFSPEYERYRRQAKYLQYNQDVTFVNGVKLGDEHCTHCDNHQTLINTMDDMKSLGWDRYLNLK